MVRWVKFLVAMEVGLLALAMIGPGHRADVYRQGNHGSLARFFMDSPSYWQAVGINFVALNVFIGCVLVAGVVVSRRRRRTAAAEEGRVGDTGEPDPMH